MDTADLDRLIAALTLLRRAMEDDTQKAIQDRIKAEGISANPLGGRIGLIDSRIEELQNVVVPLMHLTDLLGTLVLQLARERQ